MLAASDQIELVLPRGGTVSFALDSRRDRPACFALSIRKSGSSLFSNIVTAVAKPAQRTVVDVPGTFFESGLDPSEWNRSEMMKQVLRRGSVYIGFRDAPTTAFDLPVFREGRKILLVRDPRDVLVSEYFSNAYSHSLPEEGENSVISVERGRALRAGVEEYALSRVDQLNHTVLGYAAMLDQPDLLIQRYEDVIFEKRAWIGAIADFFDLPVTDGFVDLVLGWADVRPAVEEPTNFIRKVSPGDHREKLSPAAVSEIERRLDPIWRRLGYPG